MLDLRYSIIDIECLEDYFSLQVESEKDGSYKNFECFTDKDCYDLYSKLKLATRPMYYYSIDYDTAMLNALCKLVEAKKTNILYHLRRINDYIIIHKLNYFRLNKEFWVDCYFKLKKTDSYLEPGDLWERSIIKFKSMYINNEAVTNFIDEYSYILGKSKVFKNLILNSIPKIYYYYTIKTDKSIQMTISLKKLQLIYEGYNIKFDFSKYKSIKDIKKDGKYKLWLEYSENDVKFLKRLFLKKPYEDIVKRYYAYKAVKMIDNSIEVGVKELYSDNDTNLICSILQIDKPNKKLNIDYEEYITCSYPEFNEFIRFVTDNKYITRDRELKNAFCDFYNKKYIDDDYNIIIKENNVDTIINSFDEININGTIVKFGLGGVHGAIDKYIGENMFHLDYTSQYPSIILQYKQLYSNIMNVGLYEAVYNMRNKEIKPKLKTLEYGTEEYIELDRLQNGLKLILNTAYGLINSNFELPISYKPLGRLICLKGQSLLMNLSYKLIEYDPRIKLINVNTDGIIIKLPENCNIDHIVKEDEDGYFKLGVDPVKKIIQKDVNSYIKIVGDKVKTKGSFNIGIKLNINKHERLSINTINAIRRINYEPVKLLPIYFDTTGRTPINKEERAYYFTTKDKGEIAIKQTKQPTILGIDDEQFYFTDNKDNADISLYQKYADITKDKILDFTLVDKNNKTIPFIETPLQTDSDDNYKTKYRAKRKLGKLFKINDKMTGPYFIGLTGFKGDNKADSYYPDASPFKGPIKPLVHYKLTDIMKSTFCQGLSLHPGGQYLIIDVDIINKKTGQPKKGYEKVKPFIELLENSNTFKVWNNQTKEYNCKYIFRCKTQFKINKEYEKYIEILDNKATIWSLPTSDIIYENNETEPAPFIGSNYKEYVS